MIALIVPGIISLNRAMVHMWRVLLSTQAGVCVCVCAYVHACDPGPATCWASLELFTW